MNKSNALEILKFYASLGYKSIENSNAKGVYNFSNANINFNTSPKVSKITTNISKTTQNTITSNTNNKVVEKPKEEPENKIYSKLKNINNLEDLKKEVLAFEGCALKKTAISTVFGYGNENSNILLLGEGPGADEDKQGKPFVGKSGQLLTLVLESIGIKREDIFITNTVFWRPPGNRTPTNQEIQICKPFVERIIEIVNPKIIIALGATPYRFLSPDINPKITKDRGKFKKTVFTSSKEFDFIATFHPAYLLRSPLQKRLVWEDMLNIKQNFLSV